jgi:hypothetical protein
MTNVNVSPNIRNSTHDISLSDGETTIGLNLEKGAESIQEIPATPSTVRFTGGGTKYGDWEPAMSHIEQRDWSGGRGSDDFSRDPVKFYDSQNAFTLLPGKLLPAPLYKFSSGLRDIDQAMPGDLVLLFINSQVD